MGDLVDLVQRKQITGKFPESSPFGTELILCLGTSGKKILRHILEHRTPSLPSVLAREMSLLVINDGDASLRGWCMQAIDDLPEEAQRARDGNAKVINRLLGHVMKISRGRADAKAAKALLQSILTAI